MNNKTNVIVNFFKNSYLLSISLIIVLTFTGPLLCAQNQVLKGALVTQTNQLKVMKRSLRANTYAAIAKIPQDITEYLNENNRKKRKMVSVIGIIDILKNSDGFYSGEAVPAIIDAVKKSKNKGRKIIWMYDEPLWRIMSQCLQGNNKHCSEMDQDFSNSLKKLEEIDTQLKTSLGTDSFYVEGYPILSTRQSTGKEHLIMKTSLYVGMDCYENFNNCGDDRFQRFSIPQYYDMIISTIEKEEINNPLGRKLAIVPTAFTGSWVQNPVEQLDQYALWLRDQNIYSKVGLIGFFMWGSFTEGESLLEGAGTEISAKGDWITYANMRKRMKSNF